MTSMDTPPPWPVPPPSGSRSPIGPDDIKREYQEWRTHATPEVMPPEYAWVSAFIAGWTSGYGMGEHASTLPNPVFPEHSCE